MTSTCDLLLEIGTEELPAQQIQPLSQVLSQNLQAALKQAGLSHGSAKIFGTPRRIAVLLKDIPVKQDTQTIEKKGPAVKAAFDTAGNPTPACMGFATACNTTVDQLEVRTTEKGDWLFYNQTVAGKETVEILPELIRSAVGKLPLSKPMRWGAHPFEFLRPVHWIVLLFGKECVPMELFGCKSSRETFGHRFHHPDPIPLSTPDDYEWLLQEQGYVVADFEARKTKIAQAIQAISIAGGSVCLNENLLNEVTNLVEWPVPLLSKFDPAFLEVPPEVIITTIQSHQRYFPVVNSEGQLLPYFVFVSNIESKEPQKVIEGNQRVVRARLADAQFFYKQDIKQTLASRLDSLKNIIFQKGLGTLYDKSARIANLMSFLAKDDVQAQRASWLCKTDLVTTLVGEFGELQGIMGYYYAKHDGEQEEVAEALREHYSPRFITDKIPEGSLGKLLSVADKIDTITGLFALKIVPTGDKDPFGLRRAAFGVLLISIAKFNVNLEKILSKAAEGYAKVNNLSVTPEVIQEILEFMMERLRSFYTAQGVGASLFESVKVLNIYDLTDFQQRLVSVKHFLTLPEAENLIAANKRVSNLLKNQKELASTVLTKYLQEHEEKNLYESIVQKKETVEKLLKEHDYPDYRDYIAILQTLTELQAPVDAFFEKVMVMVEDDNLRQNRLALLHKLRQLFLTVADVGVIQTA